MKLIVWLGIEVTDQGGVRVCDGSWSLVKPGDERMPDGDAVEEIARRFVAHCEKMAPTGPLPEGRGCKPGHATNGRPAEHSPGIAIEDRLQALGVSAQEAGLITKLHGASRINSVLAWMARKTDKVGDPRALLLKCLDRTP